MQDKHKGKRKDDEKRDDSEEILSDPYDSTKSKKEKQNFEKELDDYPILGEDNNQFIVDTKKTGLFSKIKPLSLSRKPKIFSKGFEFIEKIEDKILPFRKKNSQKSETEDFIKPENTEEADSKFFMEGEDLEEAKDDDFILEGYEGVYNRNSLFDKKKIARYAIYSAIVILFSVSLISLGYFMSGFFEDGESGSCPYECCADSDYEEKLCSGLSECVDNECIMPECPSDFECCPGELYQERSCGSDYQECVDNECVQEECPFECCTNSDGYATKECANEGSCVNNRCYQEPCPNECCVDELDYDDKSCGSGLACRDNECIPTYLNNFRKMINFVENIISLII